MSNGGLRRASLVDVFLALTAHIPAEEPAVVVRLASRVYQKGAAR